MSCVDEQVSFGPISWLIAGEVFPLAVRGQAAALATVTNFGSNFLVGPSGLFLLLLCSHWLSASSFLPIRSQSLQHLLLAANTPRP